MRSNTQNVHEYLAGYKDTCELIERLGGFSDKVYHPIPENVENYKKLYELYKKTVRYDGKGRQRGKEIANLKGYEETVKMDD